MGSTSFLGFSYPNLLVFLNLYHIFVASFGTFSGSFIFIFFVVFLYLILG